MQCRGALIVLEGYDRVGKTTQAKLLVENLIKSGKNAKYMNFPSKLGFLVYYLSTMTIYD